MKPNYWKGVTMKNVIELIEKSAEKYPNKQVLIDPDKSYTYEELNESSKRIGTYLIDKTESRSPVIVFMEKNSDTLAAFMGIVQSGSFYVYISPEQPAERIKQILDVTKSNVVLTDNKHIEIIKDADLQCDLLLFEEAIKSEKDESQLSVRRTNMIDEDPLYCNFTSGSTGVPKGVVISHKSVLDFIDTYVTTFGIVETDVIANQAPFDFDVSVKDIYTAFYVGATIAVIPRGYFIEIMKLMDFLEEVQATIMTWAVSALCFVSQMKGLKYKKPSHVRQVLFSGEVMPMKQLKLWQEAIPKARFVNLYGPTEITCNCTYYIIDREFELDEKLPIGIPFENKRIILLDEDNKVVNDPNTRAELCVSGTGVALGYYNQKELSSKVFIQNPSHDLYRDIVYRTGDLAYYGEDGLLYFGGRKDFQIKYMGHRIELEEIELKMNRVPGIERVCCVFKKERIIAFYQGAATKEEIKTELHKVLPNYMIPTKLIQVEQFMLNKNGKIDRKILFEEA